MWDAGWCQILIVSRQTRPHNEEEMGTLKDDLFALGLEYAVQDLRQNFGSNIRGAFSSVMNFIPSFIHEVETNKRQYDYWN